MTKQAGKRLQWIDALRGIAAIMVAVVHLSLFVKESIVTHPSAAYYFIVTDFFNWGKIGVVIFFLISGYVIPQSLYRSNNKNFIINRLFRLYPAYWVSILCFCVLSTTSPSFEKLLFNITMFQKFFGVKDIIGVFWTLQIELVFYIICITLHHYNLLRNSKFVLKTYYILLVLSIVMAALRFVLHVKLPVSLFTGLTIMFLGMLWRKNDSGASNTISDNVLSSAIFAFIAAFLPISILAYSKNFGNNETWYSYYVSYLTALAVFKLFSLVNYPGRVLIYLGSISYSMYLLHPVFGIILPLKIWPKTYLQDHPYILIISFWICVLTASSISYFLIEKPFIYMGKKLISLSKKKSFETAL
ncbi:acyltransferase [Mucilaginibacter sp. JRF]|uniref:acyltransferase family protein n=1 Tax=Mucilaginibacter sp. JRF TaxID=2780088 RepID=UPI001882D24C|nr:acyltransferase [Mucilaginibacter sp. JRF]MBE9583770.1 acyltransferase [Mucilaginibacter sp. JRF]